jgi:exodeoxyribonuclease V beta subunit
VTVHAAKGLEFPVVYLPYAWDRARRKNPEVLLLHEDNRRILDVGGRNGPHYQSRHTACVAEEAGEELRLLYVAATRAQSRVVAWWAPSQQNTATSPLHRLLFGRRPGQADPDEEPDIPEDQELTDRLTEWAAGAGKDVSVEAVSSNPRSAVWRPPPREAPELDVAVFERTLSWEWGRRSYSSLTSVVHQQDRTLSEPEQTGTSDEPEAATGAPPAATASAAPSLMNTLPGGTSFGTLVHAVLEHIDTSATDLAAEVRARCVEAASRLYLTVDVNALAPAILAALNTPTPYGTLAEIAPKHRLVEVGFELPVAGAADPVASPVTLSAIADLLRAHLDSKDPFAPYPDLLRSIPPSTLQGYLTGSLDAVLRVPGPRYVVADYKTNRLFAGDINAAQYDQATMAAAMLSEHYPLQALMYSVALHRYLRWRQPGYQPDTHLGGVMYLFVRAMVGEQTPPGCGVFSWIPPSGLVPALSDLLAGI